MPGFTTALPAVDTIERQWWIVDAEGLTLGRLATEVASILRGKHKPTFTPHLDVGDYVIVINAAKVAVSGNKEEDKLYRRHSGYRGGLKTQTLARVRATFPERIVEQAVRRMLPRNRLGRSTFKKLKVYGGPEHPHAPQQPQALEIAHAKRGRD